MNPIPTVRSARYALRPEHAVQLLLVFLPLAALGAKLHWNPSAVFGFAALAIVPLAGTMGHATDALADRLGAGVGGLLNATFGNAAELILAMIALQRGYQNVVKASLTGSIIGNVLLVMGLAMLAGGARREGQHFERRAATLGSTLLGLAAIGLVVPALFHLVAFQGTSGGAARLTATRELELERGLSLAIAVVLFAAYLLSLLFSLRTHRHLYGLAAQREDASHAASGMSRRNALVLLAAATLGVAWMSEVLVGVVEAASRALGLTQVFVGVIVVAVIGNAAEHSTAVHAALRNRMDLAMSVAVGSSIQIALFVAPLGVFASYFIGPRPMDLRFTVFEVVAVALTVAVSHMVAEDGESNWLEGALLLAVYLVLGLAFYFLP